MKKIITIICMLLILPIIVITSLQYNDNANETKNVALKNPKAQRQSTYINNEDNDKNKGNITKKQKVDETTSSQADEVLLTTSDSIEIYNAKETTIPQSTPPQTNATSKATIPTTQSTTKSANVKPTQPATKPAPIQPLSTKIIAAYYASWSAYNGYTPLAIPASKLTHVHYAFANISKDLKITLGDAAIDKSNFSKLNQLKKMHPHLKTSISIGGWTWSGRFSDAALTQQSRTTFANSVISFITQYNFDGVDIDWEYPVSGGIDTNSKRPADKANFTLLLKTLREKLDEQGARDGKKYYLSFAGGAGSSFVNNTQLDQVYKIVDYGIIMTYDMHGAWDKYTDFNAPLYTPSEFSPQYKISANSAIKLYTKSGFHSSKIVMGIPFYGIVYNQVESSSNGLYSTYLKGSSLSYDKIVSNYLNKGYPRFYHSEAKVPWLFNGNTFISYDDSVSIGEKARYVKSTELAGAAVWELSQNRNGELINSIYSNIK